jgi:hypothetical protein
MNQPRHFATHALESITNSILKYDGKPKAEKSELGDYVIARQHESAIWLNRSIKFIGPEDGVFLDKLDLTTEGIDFPKLPFESICLEYHKESARLATPEITNGMFGDDIFKPTKICVLAFYPDDGSPLSDGCKKLPNYQDGDFIVVPIWERSDGGMTSWFSPTYAAVVCQRAHESSVILTRTDCQKKITIQILATNMDAKIAESVYHQYGREFDIEDIRLGWARDLWDECLAISELCNILQCANIHTETIKAPSLINKKRAKKGKAPFFEYKVLKIEDRQPSGSQLGGTHSPPRLHYRRGHIRRIAGDRKIWVRPAMVGDKSRGLIVKDYDVTNKTGAQA